MMWRAASLFFTALLALAVLGPGAALADPTTEWTPGPNAVLDNTYTGTSTFPP